MNGNILQNRSGSRPRTTPTNPHTQLEQNPEREVVEELARCRERHNDGEVDGQPAARPARRLEVGTKCIQTSRVNPKSAVNIQYLAIRRPFAVR